MYYRGPGDLHDTDYDEYRRPVEIVSKGDFSPNTPVYLLEIYPTQEYFAHYSTSNPVVGVIGAIAITVFLSVLFFMYDRYVHK